LNNDYLNSKFQKQINQIIMSLVIANPRKRSYYNPADSWLNEFFPAAPGKAGQSSSVKANVIEHSDQFVVEVAAPGFEKSQFNVKVEDDQLIITGATEKKEEKAEGEVRRREFSVRDFTRSYSLNDSVNVDAITATYENGVLTVTVPKKEEIKQESKLIEIS